MAQGGRILDTGEGSLQDLANDQSLYYGHAHEPDFNEPRCVMTVPAASTLKGRLVCSGGTWVKPAYRGIGLSALLPRISRTYALGHWDTRYTISFLSDSLARSPVLQSYGYRNIQPGYAIHQAGRETYRGSLVWMDYQDLLDDLASFLSSGLAEIDRGVDDGRREKKSVPGG